MRFASLLISSGIALAGCASNAPETEPAADQPPRTMESIFSASCPDDVDFLLPEKIGIASSPEDWHEDPEKTDDLFKKLAPVALFELTSGDQRLGGISGADFLDDDTLIVVTDQGDLMWVDIDPETSQLATSAYTTFLKDENGDPLDGKTLTDAEGVAWSGELLFISFERDHRVLAFDIEGCGAAARGIPVTSFEARDLDLSTRMTANGGAEALALLNNATLVIGLETRGSDPAPIATHDVTETGIPSFAATLNAPEATSLTGLDVIDGDRAYAVFRSYDPMRGNRISISKSELNEEGAVTDQDQLLLFGKPYTVDNYEAIAARPLNETTDRLVVISDDNFSDRQRTLLAVFDVARD